MINYLNIDGKVTRVHQLVIDEYVVAATQEVTALPVIIISNKKILNITLLKESCILFEYNINFLKWLIY